MKSIKRFMQYYKPYRNLFLTDMFCALILSGIDLIFPLLVRFLLNDVYVWEDQSKIVRYVLYIGSALLIMYIVRYFCQYFITSWGHIMGARMEADMRKDLFDISELAHHGPEDIFISILKLGGSFIILLNINVNITLILIFFTIIMLYFSVSYNKRMRITFKKNREKIADVNAVVQDSLAGIRVVKSFANEDIESRKFRKGNSDFLETKEDNYFVMGKFFSGNGFFQGILYLSVILSGGFFIVLRNITVSDLVIYILYINIFLSPIEKLVNFTEQFQRGISGFERFLEIIETEPDIQDKSTAVELENPEGVIEFKDVSFSYNDKHNILENINISIPAGKNIALVGPSGSGKTTFCSLIPRFYEISEGKITVDGIDIRDMKLKSLRNAIGIVQQDVYLFAGTIKVVLV